MLDIQHYSGIALLDPTRTLVLLLERSILKPDGSERFLGGLVSGIGGKFEFGETDIEALLREKSQETKDYINPDAVTDIRKHLVLHDYKTHPRPHTLHWFTGILHQQVDEFVNEEGRFFWEKATNLPLPLGVMTPPAHASLSYIVGIKPGDDVIREAHLGYDGKNPVLDFISQ